MPILEVIMVNDGTMNLLNGTWVNTKGKNEKKEKSTQRLSLYA